MINPRFAGGIFRLLVFAPPCANACAVFRPCGLRFAPCPRGSSRFAASGFAPCSPASPAPSPLAARGYGPAYFRLRTGRAFGGPVFRVCALRFAPCARHSSRFAAFGSKLPGPSRPSASLITARCSVSAHCASLRVLDTPAASRPPGSHRSSIQHGRPTPSHRPALTLARCSAPADFASLRVLGAPAASRPPLLTSSLVALPASLGSSYRPALRWPGILGLRSASRCPRPLHPFGASTATACFAHCARPSCSPATTFISFRYTPDAPGARPSAPRRRPRRAACCARG